MAENAPRGGRSKRDSWIAPSGYVAMGYHASGHPIFEKDLLQPTSMHYSKPGENIYDNAPGQTAPSDMEVVNEAYKTGFSHTQTGTYDNTPNQKERTDCDFGQPCIK